LEAMALGLAPVVVDYGGPAELVTDETGFKVPLSSRAEMIGELREMFSSLIQRPDLVRAVGLRARERVLRHFTWSAKARQTTQVYRWVTGEVSRKPDFGVPISDLPRGRRCSG